MTMGKPLKRRRDPGQRRRAFWALSGFYVPKAGDEGRFSGHGFASTFRVRVTRVSATGKTIWVRFVSKLPEWFTDLPRGREAEYPYWYEPEVECYLMTPEASRSFLADGTPMDSPKGRLRFR